MHKAIELCVMVYYQGGYILIMGIFCKSKGVFLPQFPSTNLPDYEKAHRTFLNFVRKVNDSERGGDFLNPHGISFHLSHQTHLYVSHHFYVLFFGPKGEF